MLEIKNIEKLRGSVIGEWKCYMIDEHKDHYTMMFKLIQTPGVITQFRLFKEARIKGRWELRARMDSRNVFVGQFHSHSYNDVQTISKSDLSSFDSFCRTLMNTLHKFNDILRMGIPTYHTSSLSTFPNRVNSGGHSFGGHQIPKPPVVSQPSWYVSKEEVKEVKPPTMWETFKEMVKWDKWAGYIAPTSIIDYFITKNKPKTKKVLPKKAP